MLITGPEVCHVDRCQHGCSRDTGCRGIASRLITEATPLHRFLDAAAGEGLVLGGVDAADLYIEQFPEIYAAKIAIPTPLPGTSE